MNVILKLFLCFITASVLASEPPALPPGLSIPETASQVTDQDSDIADDDDDSGITGFWDNRLGYRIQSNDLHDQLSISESRLHLEKSSNLTNLSLQTAVDIVYDAHPDASHSNSFQRGESAIDIRKLSLAFKASADIDVRMGRQVLTWGNGDLLFLNDFFPKDFRYWIGRDIEYSKAPSDAIKISFYSSLINLDLVYTPQFDADRFIDGSRLSFYDNRLGKIIGKADTISVDIPDDPFHDDELAYRLYKTIDDMEFAVYGYHGFYKSPSAFNVTLNRYQFSRLESFGASLRKPIGSGILSLETAYWSSLDDKDGRNPLVANGETRAMAGYEWEAASNFTVGVQYYAEKLHHYNRYLQGLSDPTTARDEILTMLTLRLDKRLLNEDLKLGLFVNYSTSDGDYYLRPEINYRLSDEWIIKSGATLFDGDKEHQTWAQFKDNSNVFLALKYSFSSGD